MYTYVIYKMFLPWQVKYFLMATKNWEMAPQNTLVAILQVDCIDLEQSSS